jgi:hypothetical protein
MPKAPCVRKFADCVPSGTGSPVKTPPKASSAYAAARWRGTKRQRQTSGEMPTPAVSVGWYCQ